jgi:hypothetical protein
MFLPAREKAGGVVAEMEARRGDGGREVEE